LVVEIVMPGTDIETPGRETETPGTETGGRLGMLGSVTGRLIGGVEGVGLFSTGGAVGGGIGVGVGVGAGVGVGVGDVGAGELFVGGAAGATATISRVSVPLSAEVSGVLTFGFLDTGVLRGPGTVIATFLWLRRCWD
jgi:hypothetical protein